MIDADRSGVPREVGHSGAGRLIEALAKDLSGGTADSAGQRVTGLECDRHIAVVPTVCIRGDAASGGERRSSLIDVDVLDAGRCRIASQVGHGGAGRLIDPFSKRLCRRIADSARERVAGLKADRHVGVIPSVAVRGNAADGTQSRSGLIDIDLFNADRRRIAGQIGDGRRGRLTEAYSEDLSGRTADTAGQIVTRLERDRHVAVVPAIRIRRDVAKCRQRRSNLVDQR